MGYENYLRKFQQREKELQQKKNEQLNLSEELIQYKEDKNIDNTITSAAIEENLIEDKIESEPFILQDLIRNKKKKKRKKKK